MDKMCCCIYYILEFLHYYKKNPERKQIFLHAFITYEYNQNSLSARLQLINYIIQLCLYVSNPVYSATLMRINLEFCT